MPRPPARACRYDAGGIDVIVTCTPSGMHTVRITMQQQRRMVLHWGVDEWVAADSADWPPGSRQMDSQAVQSPFQGDSYVQLQWPEDKAPERVVFVLKVGPPVSAGMHGLHGLNVGPLRVAMFAGRGCLCLQVICSKRVNHSYIRTLVPQTPAPQA